MKDKFLSKETLDDIKNRDYAEYKDLLIKFAKFHGDNTFSKLIEVTIALYLRHMLQTTNKDEMMSMQQSIHALSKLFDTVEGAYKFKLKESKINK